MTAVEFLQAQFDKHLYYVEGYYNAKPYTLQDLVNDFDTALAMERSAIWKEEQLQQRIEQLQKEYDWACGEINKWRENAEEWAARCQELEEMLGKSVKNFGERIADKSAHIEFLDDQLAKKYENAKYWANKSEQLEKQLEIAAKDANAAWMYNRNANEKIKELEEKLKLKQIKKGRSAAFDKLLESITPEERQEIKQKISNVRKYAEEGKFAEWTYEQGCKWDNVRSTWKVNTWQRNHEGWIYVEKTTPELWAEWDRCGSI